MRRPRGRTAAAALLSLLFAAAAHGGSTIEARSAALSTASPLATKAGLDVLRRGGNAIDAAVAVSFALAVVHPQAGNIGGGGFLLYYDAGTRDIWALDFRETAPGAARRDMFQMPDGAVAPEIRTGPGSAAVPGTVAGLAAAHERFGSRPWRDLLVPAMAMARQGFGVDAELERDLAQERDARKIDQFSATAAIFFPEGRPAANRSKLVQTDLGITLERIAAGGADDFYRGETARRLADGVRAAGGTIGERDLREYQPVWRSPLKIRFRDYEIYTMPPPSGGGVVLAAALNILAGYDLQAAGFQTPLSVHLLAEASRRAYIDRNRYIGDPASARIPFGRLLSPERAAQWRSSIELNRATPTITLTSSGGAVVEGTHTTHFTIVDREGNIAALTTTLNENFGSGFVVPGCGFFLNNAMQDFLAGPGKPDRTGLVAGAANSIEPGKRMASSMTPAIIFHGGRPLLALGTGGGPAIPTTLLQVFLNIAIHGKSVAEAVAAPRFHHQSAPERLDFEKGRAPQPLLDVLASLGHSVKPHDRIGDVHAVAIYPGRLVAVADPRRGGAAGGL